MDTDQRVPGPQCVNLQVNLGYAEANQQKNALVKLRVCPEHALQLNHKKDAAVLKVKRLFVAEQRLRPFATEPFRPKHRLKYAGTGKAKTQRAKTSQ